MNDLDHIKTAQDLINAQESNTDSNLAQKHMDRIVEDSPAVGLQLVKLLLLELEELHHSVYEKLLTDKKDYAPDWLFDAGKLHSAFEIIEDIGYGRLCYRIPRTTRN
jgi:hypothetical protein